MGNKNVSPCWQPTSMERMSLLRHESKGAPTDTRNYTTLHSHDKKMAWHLGRSEEDDPQRAAFLDQLAAKRKKR